MVLQGFRAWDHHNPRVFLSFLIISEISWSPGSSKTQGFIRVFEILGYILIYFMAGKYRNDMFYKGFGDFRGPDDGFPPIS